MGSKALAQGVLVLPQNEAHPSGVPESMAVPPELSDSPVGRVPVKEDHVYGMLPPMAENGTGVGVYGTPTVPVGSVGGGGTMLSCAHAGIPAAQRAISMERT
jgi:hypothetical protein